MKKQKHNGNAVKQPGLALSRETVRLHRSLADLADDELAAVAGGEWVNVRLTPSATHTA